MSVGTIDELLALPAADLAELLADAAPGELPEVQAAALGLDLEIAEHRAAVLAAVPVDQAADMATRGARRAGLGGQVQPDPPVSAAHAGVRLDLTPDPPAAPDPQDGMGTAPEPPTEPLSPERFMALLEQHRGSDQPFMAGTYALYSAPNGSIVLVTQTPRGEVNQLEIPARVIRMAMAAVAGKNPLKKLFGG